LMLLKCHRERLSTANAAHAGGDPRTEQKRPIPPLLRRGEGFPGFVLAFGDVTLDEPTYSV
jgi:hypothetical protein